MTTAIAPTVAFVVAYLMLHWMLASGSRWLPLDHPNARSLHVNPIPRVGGLAIMAGILAAMTVTFSLWIPVLLSVVYMGVSLLDDIKGLGVMPRLLIHIAVAALYLAWAVPHMPPLLWGILLLALVWGVNLYNFMDGSDGLAGGMAFFGFGSLAIAAQLAGALDVALASASVAMAALAFLRFNFHPAMVFMGDVGSIPLGFLAGAISILGWQSGLWSAAFPFVVFSPFLVDATATLTRRLLRGEKVWQAHRTHYYQRLIQSGMGHRNTALMEYGLMAFSGFSAVLGERTGHMGAVLLFWALLYPILMREVDRRWRGAPEQSH